jgi:hypothetical protein
LGNITALRASLPFSRWSVGLTVQHSLNSHNLANSTKAGFPICSKVTLASFRTFFTMSDLIIAVAQRN